MGCAQSVAPVPPQSPAPAKAVASSKGRGERTPKGQVKGKGKGKGGRQGDRSLKELKKSKFQVQLEGQFADYGPEEDAILKRAFLVGRPKALFHLRGQDYEYSFDRMLQRNLNTGKERKIRAPRGMVPPAKPILPPGPMTVIVVPADAGESIEIEDPNNPGRKLTVMLPAKAKKGSQLAVPLPEKGEEVEAAAKRQGQWTTGGKVAAAGAAAGALAVGGVILGEHLSGGAVSEWAAASPELAAAGEWIEGAAEDVADWVEPAAAEAGAWAEGAAEDAGEWVAGAAEDVGDWAAEAADDVADWIGSAGADAGDFVMGLF